MGFSSLTNHVYANALIHLENGCKLPFILQHATYFTYFATSIGHNPPFR